MILEDIRVDMQHSMKLHLQSMMNMI